MKTAKVFRSGNSQAVRIPKEFQLEGDEVEIRRKGNALILLPKSRSWESLFDSLTKFTDDFLADGRRQPPLQSVIASSDGPAAGHQCLHLPDQRKAAFDIGTDS